MFNDVPGTILPIILIYLYGIYIDKSFVWYVDLTQNMTGTIYLVHTYTNSNKNKLILGMEYLRNPVATTSQHFNTNDIANHIASEADK